MVTRQCCALTRKKRPCTINADRCRGGKWYCHLHDEQGLYQRQKRGEA